MFPTALLLSALALGADPKVKAPYIEVPVEQADKFSTKPEKFAAPAEITSAEELAKFIEDEATRTRIAKAVDFKSYSLLVFSWRGSSGDRIEVKDLATSLERYEFKIAPGKSDDLHTHVKLYALRNDVKYVAK